MNEFTGVPVGLVFYVCAIWITPNSKARQLDGRAPGRSTLQAE